MKLLLVTLLATLAVAFAVPQLANEEYEYLFTKFIDQHSKKYEDHYELFKRFAIFKSNLDFIRNHQANPNRDFQLAMNKFGDLSNEEFTAMYNNFRPRKEPYLRSKNQVNLTNVNVPASVDWRDKGVVTPVKDQGQCGSCWSFSATGSMESAHAIKTGSLISISEQELVDCSGAYGNQGCNGGLMDQAFEFVQANGGLCTESSYPYEARDDTCRSSRCTSAFSISGYTDVRVNSEDALQAAVAQQPVSVAVDAAGENWQFYSSGVMSSSCGTQLDHGVLAAGYGTDTGKDFWLVKNSWGTGWGESGYIRLSRGSGSGSPGQCGICMAASYPTA